MWRDTTSHDAQEEGHAALKIQDVSGDFFLNHHSRAVYYQIFSCDYFDSIPMDSLSRDQHKRMMDQPERVHIAGWSAAGCGLC